ncbi:uncharacterized protein [Euphorbia lathyris]|uniref:uncharacterized protein n=1 Tax=Euphorbia lathyris TaxID=212925 RepID=UPI0033138FA0
MELSSHLVFRPSLTLICSSSYKRCRVLASARRKRRRRDEQDHNYSGGRLVDMNMIVLRKRIHEMKMVERNYQPPYDWSDWEKHYFSNYDSLICEVMSLLQSELMNTRPFVALGIFALLALSLPFSTAMLFSHFMDMLPYH